ncbi:MAG: glycosyltransferase family 4 protein [Petrimonas sp.]|nr:glycosyltransferase family 4 protein [Petrimonas sp.]MEA5080299.1 glycosyltransferase family 4 protein [Dysgonamonadaceae bacterium]
MRNNISILYVGNKLSKFGYTPGVIETLGKQLEKYFIIIYAGTKKNIVIRLLEMIFKTIKNRKKITYILIDTYSTKAFWYAYIIGRLSYFLNIKYIPILHGGDLPERLLKSKRKCDILFNRSYKNVAVSGYLNFYFEKAGYNSIIIPNNINIKNYDFLKRKEIRPRLLWVRSFQKEYNPKLAIDVLKQLSILYPDTILCMVGPDKDGSIKVISEYASKQGLDDKLKITGRLSKKEWHKLSEDFDIFINTTNFDNTPVSVIEAMALGLPIVSTNVGGLPFLLNNKSDAILVEPNDPLKMCDAIQYLITNPSFAIQIAENARKKAESFDWKITKSKWLNLLK